MDKSKLISAIYSATLGPDQFDQILDELDDAIFGSQSIDLNPDVISIPGLAPALNDMAKFSIDPDLQRHIQQVENIQKRIGRGGMAKSKIHLLIDAAPSPAVVFDRAGCVLATNALARIQNDKPPRLLSDFCDDPEILKSINDFCETSQGQKLLIIPDYVNKESRKNSCAVVRKLSERDLGGLVARDGSQSGVFLFTLLDFVFEPETTQIFQENYQLTDAETQVISRLSSGYQPAQIAEERSSSIATIRTQIKSIKRKTKSPDIAAIVRLFCGFSSGIIISTQFSDQPIGTLPSDPDLVQNNSIQLRDGRRLHYTQQGDPHGEPVLMFHNMPYGMIMPQKAAINAKRMNLRIITPYRPGYGKSDQVRGIQADKLLDIVAADANELLDRLELPAAVIVGQSMGSYFAMRFATLYPGRVGGLLAISRAPIWREKWARQMPKRQQFVMRIAKFFPQLLPVVIRVVVNFVDAGKVKTLMENLVKTSPVDGLVLKNNPEIYDLIANDCLHGFRHGGDAFCSDALLTIRDLTSEAKISPHKFHILHGDKDGIVAVNQSRTFADEIPGSTLEIIEGAGHFLFYSHWKQMFKTIKSFQKSKF